MSTLTITVGDETIKNPIAKIWNRVKAFFCAGKTDRKATIVNVGGAVAGLIVIFGMSTIGPSVLASCFVKVVICGLFTEFLKVVVGQYSTEEKRARAGMEVLGLTVVTAFATMLIASSTSAIVAIIISAILVAIID